MKAENIILGAVLAVGVLLAMKMLKQRSQSSGPAYNLNAGPTPLYEAGRQAGAPGFYYIDSAGALNDVLNEPNKPMVWI